MQGQAVNALTMEHTAGVASPQHLERTAAALTLKLCRIWPAAEQSNT